MDLLYLVILLNFAAGSLTQEILGCGGFVKSSVNIDFSKIEVQLYTAEGMLKYQTECAPNNGYFMIPFVDKGNFVLKIDPPKGWLFEPMSVNLHVDGVSDPCTKGNDINFIFKGFTVLGKILNVDIATAGPQDVTVALKSAENKNTVSSVKTEKGGLFSFIGVTPGEYEVMASHPTYAFKQYHTMVSVVDGNTMCKDEIVVSGYDVHGHVVSQSKATQLPVAGVHFLLFTKVEPVEKVSGCVDARPDGSNDIVSATHPFFVCATASKTDGRYLFPSLSPAEYIIVPFHRGDRIQFDVEPRQLRFSVINSRVVNDNGFKVTGFSVQGRVMSAENGAPIEGAELTIDGRPSVTTDVSGFYTLKHMNNGVYDVNVEKAGMSFATRKMRVWLDTPTLPDIIPDRFAVSGSVTIHQLPSGAFKMADVTMRIESEADDGKFDTVKLNEEAEFSFMRAPGNYKVTPVISSKLRERGLAIKPQTVDITVSDEAVRDVTFAQYRAAFDVRVTCVDSCAGVVVELVGQQKNVKVQDAAADVTVQFKYVLPGRYTVRVSHANWCWKKDSHELEVPVEGAAETLHFQQSGFILVCSISHDVDMEIRHRGADSTADSVALKKGRNRLCLARLGEYELTPRSCHHFDGSRPLRYDTREPRPVALQASKHRALVVMETASRAVEDDRVDVAVTTSKGKVNKGKLVLTKKPTSEDETLRYELVYWAGDGDNLTFEPSSSHLLFEPRQISATVSAADCWKVVASFRGIAGKFISGRVNPPLANVDIAITRSEEASESPIHLKTNEDGSYRVGPLHPNHEYQVSASLEDYTFVPTDDAGNFIAKKLGKLVFQINLEETETALQGVLLTISGGSYRSNNLTGADGMLALTKLEPGQYYFKAMMKEYQFQPSSQVIELEEGEEKTIKVSGHRVAYSCYGLVTSLNGEPEVGVVVRASAVECRAPQHVEEAATGADGDFAVRGLLPGCRYHVRVHDVARFSHVTPARVEHVVAADDLRAVRFVAFRPLTTFALSGQVVARREFLPFIKIGLYRANEQQSAVATVTMSDATPFFHFPPIARNESEYIARLECSLATSVYDYSAPAAGFFAVGPHKHLTFHFDPKVRQASPDTLQVSMTSLPLTFLAIFLAYNCAQVLAYVQNLASWVMSKYASTQETSGRSGGRKTRK